MEERIDHIERQMEDYTTTYNELVDAHIGHTEELQYLKAKIANLEDHSRWNNIKFRDIPETVKNKDLV